MKKSRETFKKYEKEIKVMNNKIVELEKQKKEAVKAVGNPTELAEKIKKVE